MFHKILSPTSRPLILTALMLLLPVHLSQAETVKVPIKIDFAILRQLLLSQLFEGKQASTEILHDPNGCSEIILSDPELSELNGHLQINAHLDARLAVKILSQCVSLSSWQGYAQIITQPHLKPDNPKLIYFQIINSHLINLDKEVLSNGMVWAQAKKHLHPLFEQFRLDLAPSINEMNKFLPVILPKHSQAEMTDILNSLNLGKIQISQDAIITELAFNLDNIPAIKQSERPLTEQELQRWQTKWQSMDALLTHTIKYYAAATELEALRLTLLDILIDARYQLLTALQQQQNNDPVRHWFINSWSKLIPVIKQINTENPRHASLAIASLIAASDILLVLDKLGPKFGLDISIDGLRRLARLLNQTPNDDPLQYNEALDPELLKLFQLKFQATQQSQATFNLWPISFALAANDQPLEQWLSNKQDLNNYLLKIRRLLLNTSQHSVSQSKLNRQQKDVFKKMLLTTAWQESCWRQYVVKQNKIVPLRSSTGDTGIMQINEKVWRGFVDKHRLRWDIQYNIETGSNILLNYMTRYAIKNAEHKQRGGIDNLARASYSAYNGGPAQFSRYRNSHALKEHQKIDKAFHAKYLTVKKGNELAVAKCLGQNQVNKSVTPTKKVASVSKAKKKQVLVRASKKRIHDKIWIKKQPKHYFTLQIGVFSTHQGASKFIQQQGMNGNYAIYQQRKNRQSQYAVIYGYYSTRQRAKNGSKHFNSINPWIRSFNDLHRIISH